MVFRKKKSQEETIKDLIKKGNKAFDDEDFQKSYDFYHEAVELDENRIELYDRLIEILKMHEDDWTEEHFAHSMHWEMKKQEIKDPKFKRIHAREEESFKAVSNLIKNAFSAKDTKKETEFVEEIVKYGPEAIYPLIDFILIFKEVGQNKKKNEES